MTVQVWSPDRYEAAAIAILGLAAAIAVALLPDRTHFIGDAIWRQGAVGSDEYGRLFPQSLTLDRLIFSRVPAALGLTLSGYGRVTGVVACIALAVAAWHFVRVCRLRGVAALLGVALIVVGGHLTVFAGLAKPTALICVLAVVAVSLSVELAERGRHAWWLAVVLIVAVFLHRSGVLLLVPAVAGLVLHARGIGKVGWKKIAPPIVVVLGSLILMWPQLRDLLLEYDAPRNLSTLANPSHLISASHLRDVVSVVLVMSPLFPLALIAFVLAPRLTATSARVPVVTALVALGFIVVLQPPQGALRDWDVFALPGLCLSLLAASVLPRTVVARRRSVALPLAMLLTVFGTSFAWLANAADRSRGLRWVESLATQVRDVPPGTRAQIHDYLGTQYARDEDWVRAAYNVEEAAHLTPHRRMFLTWGMYSTYAGNPRNAMRAYRTRLKQEDDPIAWAGLAGAALAAADTVVAREAMEHVARYPAGSAQVRLIQGYIQRYPQLWDRRFAHLLPRNIWTRPTQE